MSDRAWFSYRRRVGWADVDPSGNYQFTAALRFVEEAEVAWLRDLGVLGCVYPRLPRTFVQASFASPARFDDDVTVSVRTRRLGRSSIEYEFQIGRGDQLCADGVIGAAFIGDDGRPRPLPDHVRAALGGSPGHESDMSEQTEVASGAS